MFTCELRLFQLASSGLCNIFIVSLSLSLLLPCSLSSQLRQYGIKLLILWVQALQENANDACMELFASAIPHFPPRKTPEGLPLPNPSSSLPASLSPTSGSAPSGLSDRYGVYTSAKGGELSSYKYPSSMSLTTASASKGQLNCRRKPVHAHIITSISLTLYYTRALTCTHMHTLSYM